MQNMDTKQINDKLLRLLKKSKIDLENNESLTKDNFNYFIELLQQKFIDDQDRMKLLERSLSKSSSEIKEYIKTIEETKAFAIHTSKMAEVGSMASNISHEINNPLAIINGTAELLLYRISQLESKQGGNEHCDQMKGYCDTMLKTTKKVGKIISGLRRLSNAGSSSDMIEKTEENLNVLIEESFAFGLETLKKSRINLTFEATSPKIVANVMGVELSQVIVNLITNAKQALEKLDNTIPKKIHIKLEEMESYIKIVITNTGPKIPQEIEHKIFDSFFTTKKAGEGSGIGLHISQKIMEHMKGKIYLNTDWESPQFVIEFPKK